MVTRRFGRTGLQMPVLSCGGMRYQDGWKDKPLDEIPSEIQENLEATIHRAIECGINHIETARGYGPSERQLGLVLPRLDRDRTIIQTKIGPNEDPAVFTEQFHESLERLRIDRVDLLAIHGINDAATLEMSVKPGGCFDACQKIREAGLARFIGFSTHGPTDIICQAIAHGQAETGAGFDYVNLHWYYIFQRNWPAIELASAGQGRGVDGALQLGVQGPSAAQVEDQPGNAEQAGEQHGGHHGNHAVGIARQAEERAMQARGIVTRSSHDPRPIAVGPGCPWSRRARARVPCRSRNAR